MWQGRGTPRATASCEIVLFVCVFYQLKGARPTDTNSTHQNLRNTDPAYIAAATEQFHTVAHGREVGLPAFVAQILEQPWSRVTLLYSLFRRVWCLVIFFALGMTNFPTLQVLDDLQCLIISHSCQTSQTKSVVRRLPTRCAHLCPSDHLINQTQSPRVYVRIRNTSMRRGTDLRPSLLCPQPLVLRSHSHPITLPKTPFLPYLSYD